MSYPARAEGLGKYDLVVYRTQTDKPSPIIDIDVILQVFSYKKLIFAPFAIFCNHLHFSESRDFCLRRKIIKYLHLNFRFQYSEKEKKNVRLNFNKIIPIISGM